MEINHCCEGRFECDFKSGEVAYLGEGDLAINSLGNQPYSTYFPLSHYHGISILINIPLAQKTINDVSEVLGKIKINLYELLEKLKGDCFIMRATNIVQHIFSELYNAPENLRAGYLQLKVMELLLFLDSTDLKEESTERQYFYKVHVDTIKEIKTYLTTHIEERFTQQELSERFHIPLTTMKSCFKGVYGMPLSSYMREYRMQAASVMLQNSNESIYMIAKSVGYETFLYLRYRSLYTLIRMISILIINVGIS